MSYAQATVAHQKRPTDVDPRPTDVGRGKAGGSERNRRL
ncbi:hypothetical protein J2S49_000742 [Arcanobacterium wilhelmae]|uniref:Uncharacterized protein n=1 Tax=Arcanobacterium wilhelmae TaxID=1803177 RepID=A0ABT9NAF8_9ACTO|nr:hypothetical protein [Arcanobacterium wilhelmae]